MKKRIVIAVVIGLFASYASLHYTERGFFGQDEASLSPSIVIDEREAPPDMACTPAYTVEAKGFPFTITSRYSPGCGYTTSLSLPGFALNTLLYSGFVFGVATAATRFKRS